MSDSDFLQEIFTFTEDLLKPIGDLFEIEILVGKGTEPIEYEQDAGDWFLTYLIYLPMLGLCLFTRFAYTDCINNGSYVTYFYMNEWGISDVLSEVPVDETEAALSPK